MRQDNFILELFLSFVIFVVVTEAKSLNLQNEKADLDLECYPTPRPNAVQYIIGYGSLMHSASIKWTVNETGQSIPIQVQGFRREWNLKRENIGPGNTVLGVTPDPNSSFNGVAFHLTEEHLSVQEDLKEFDSREKNYCRKKVGWQDIHILGGHLAGQTGVEVKDASELESGQRSNIEFWIYVNKPEYVGIASKEYPIVQSYVDTFLSGCLDFQGKYNLKDFAKTCVTSTKGWSEFWVNDRIYPRRPFVFEPLADKIDTILKEQLPRVFDKIQIEG